ncbi:hypothetical protein C8263_04060 [Deinococcus arcticus]|uniref:Uncharacterized protein n=1 Tax=Deinococcus arcticus TaxID=2136176 RepID=A0A2T3WAQ1_9DEIO|nr:hypothetical protein C8263_04060 [Deinococcus arcticus]
MKGFLVGAVSSLGVSLLFRALIGQKVEQAALAAALILLAFVIWKKGSDKGLWTAFLWLFCALCVLMALLGIWQAIESSGTGPIFWTAVVVIALSLPCAWVLARAALRTPQSEEGKT